MIKETANIEQKIDVKHKIHDDYQKKIYTEGNLSRSSSTQSFLSDDGVKDLLLELRDHKISKDFKIDRRCLLSPMMIDQFIKHKPIDMDEFREKIPYKFRENIDRNQLFYMDSIFEILEMANE